MNPIATAFVRLRPELSTFSKESEKGISGGLKGQGEKQGRNFGSLFSKAAGAAMAGGAIVALLAKSISDARSLGMVPLKVAVKDAGIAWAKFNPQLVATDKTMEKLGFTNSQTNSAMLKLVTITGSQSLSFKALATAADLATYKHISLADAAVSLGRAATGNTRALKEVGIATNDLPKKFATTGTEASRMAIVMDLLGKKIGGQAVAASTTFGGKLAVMKARMTDLSAQVGLALIPILSTLMDLVGQYLIPAFTALGVWLTNVGAPAFKDWAQRIMPMVIFVITNMVTGVQFALKIFSQLPGPVRLIALAMIAWSVANALWEATNPVGQIMLLAAAVAFAVGWIVKHWRQITAVVIEVRNAVFVHVGAMVNTFKNGIMSVVNFFVGWHDRIQAAVGNVRSLLTQKGKDVIQGFWDGLTFVWKKVTSWVSSIAGWIKAHKGPISLDKNLLKPAGSAIMDGFLGGLQSGFGPVGSFVGGIASWIGNKVSGTSGVGQWTGVVLQALSMLHLPSNLLGLVLNQMQSESGGNPNAINRTDINAQMGDPSRGLLQTIGATFEYWRSKALPDNIYDPLANVYAALNYAMHGKGFGTGMGQMGSMHGYALGGVINEPIVGVGRSGQRYSFGENGKETVTPGVGGRLGKLADTIIIRESADADLITQRLTWQLQHAGLG
jgi:hypothetical protein